MVGVPGRAIAFLARSYFRLRRHPGVECQRIAEWSLRRFGDNTSKWLASEQLLLSPLEAAT